MEESGEFDLLPKKEVLGLKKEMAKLQENLGGIKNMRTLPGIMFIVDPHNEAIPISSTTSSPATTMRSARSSSSRPSSPTPSSRQTRAKRSMQLPLRRKQLP